jgi:hypothetical protein
VCNTPDIVLALKMWKGLTAEEIAGLVKDAAQNSSAFPPGMDSEFVGEQRLFYTRALEVGRRCPESAYDLLVVPDLDSPAFMLGTTEKPRLFTEMLVVSHCWSDTAEAGAYEISRSDRNKVAGRFLDVLRAVTELYLAGPINITPITWDDLEDTDED